MQFHDIVYLLLSLLIIYIYVGYPVLLWVLARLFRQRHYADTQYCPMVTLVISAFNEEKVIRDKLFNALQLNYPKEKLSIMVVSDGSTDATESIVQEFKDSGVKLLRTSKRNGKTAGLNQALQIIDSEIVVFSDANALYNVQAIRNLVKHFADQRIGYVVGHARYVEENNAAGKSERGYWDYEIRLKKWESDFASVVGGDGAIYAIRTELWQPLNETDINDFVNPLQIIVKGFRGIFEPNAWCTERPAGDFGKEFKRKKRIVNRSFNGILQVPGCLNPLKVGRFSFLILSHKILRWFSAFLLCAHWLLSIYGLFAQGRFVSFYMIMLGPYYLIFLLALIGNYQAETKTASQPLFYYPYYYFLVIFSAAYGILLRLRGVVIYKWQTVREDRQIIENRESITERILVVALFVSLCSLIIYLPLYIDGAPFFAYLLAVLLAYTYFGFPCIVSVFAALKPVHNKVHENNWPSLTLLIVAYNEEAEIRNKLENSLTLDYPHDRYRIVVASDGSTDSTNDIIREFENRGVSPKIYSENRGKIAAINQTMAQLDSELVVLSDANVIYDKSALKQLARHFEDERVGVVSGRVILTNESLSYSEAEKSYYSFEHYIQHKEGQTGTLVGADGAMYAIRRRLFSPPAEDTILDDFVISMQICCKGYLALHENKALGYERNDQEIDKEFRRKRRIIAGGYQVLRRGQGIPGFSMPVHLLYFFSHKVLRWISGPLFILFAVVLIFQQAFGGNDLFLTCCFFAFAISAILAGVAHIWTGTRKNPIFGLIYYQYMLILASIAGCWKGIIKGQHVTWRKTS
ncbi:glycosyltransferase family 2 protein [uncultured Desulfosarcina sp.]|uniref:glycosyltransferase family 2 protein n=1 Tax=uncultured Desulfosarcina sp. TaxID=218289 RepID=UPI0029C86234|nr:glycosyltransferase family 2 protein [uncultured Desulfosarcina sp.]